MKIHYNVIQRIISQHPTSYTIEAKRLPFGDTCNAWNFHNLLCLPYCPIWTSVWYFHIIIFDCHCVMGVCLCWLLYCYHGWWQVGFGCWQISWVCQCLYVSDVFLINNLITLSPHFLTVAISFRNSAYSSWSHFKNCLLCMCQHVCLCLFSGVVIVIHFNFVVPCSPSCPWWFWWFHMWCMHYWEIIAFGFIESFAHNDFPLFATSFLWYSSTIIGVVLTCVLVLMIMQPFWYSYFGSRPLPSLLNSSVTRPGNWGPSVLILPAIKSYTNLYESQCICSLFSLQTWCMLPPNHCCDGCMMVILHYGCLCTCTNRRTSLK